MTTNSRKQYTQFFRSSSLGEESDSNHFHEVDGGNDSNSSSSSPLFSVGVIADIQYAPIPDGYSFSGNPRYYRHALVAARHAAQHFQDLQVDLMLNLGDTIDGKCQEIAKNGGDPFPEGTDPGQLSLDHVLEALSPYKGPVIHTYGNHCLYNLDRSMLANRLGIEFVQEPCGELVAYFHRVHKGVRFIVLDSYDEAIMQRCEVNSLKHRRACEILKKNNPNYAKGKMNSPEGLSDLEKRFVGFNGGIGSIQLQWLHESLQEARRSNEKSIVLSHQPIMPGSTNPVCLIWNYDEVLSVLREYADVVVASFSGHAHKGGYVRDPESGIHFRVFEAALENMPERTYAVVDVHDDHLKINGFGNCMSATFDFSHMVRDTAP